MAAKKNAFYAQSGGVTSVINASACGVIEAANKSYKINKVFAGKNGILGALNEELIDTSRESKSTIAKLKQTPGGAFGSCRFKLQDPIKQKKEYERLFEVFEAHNIGFFFYNGGGDSQDTTFKISEMAKKLNFPLQCIGIPKTVDNDLPFTDCSPGFGSVAKYVATSTLEEGFNLNLEIIFPNGKFLADAGSVDAFGHKLLGGVAPFLAEMVTKLGLKNHWAVADYLQRSARHIASKTDLDQAYAVGKYAVQLALAGKTGLMPTIRRVSEKPY